jgi:hypothetical protein
VVRNPKLVPSRSPTQSSITSCGQRHSGRRDWLSLYVSLLYCMIGPPSMRCDNSFGIANIFTASQPLSTSPIIFQYHRVGRRRCRASPYDVALFFRRPCYCSTYLTKHVQHLEHSKDGCCTETNLNTMPTFVSSTRSDVHCGGWRPNPIRALTTKTWCEMVLDLCTSMSGKWSLRSPPIHPRMDRICSLLSSS